jgi:hypothetical protein
MACKRAALAAMFIAVGLLPAGVFAGGRKDPAATSPQREAPPAWLNEDPVPEAPAEVPPRPVTREILELIGKSQYDLTELQFFISTDIALEHGKRMQIDIEINENGEAKIEESNAQEKIIIPKDTGGVLIPDEGATVPGGPRTLKICFGDLDDNTLVFRENPADGRYYLTFREDRLYGEFTEFGNESYRVSFAEIPYLYARLAERTDTQPRIRELRGRFVIPREMSAPDYDEGEAPDSGDGLWF